MKLFKYLIVGLLMLMCVLALQPVQTIHAASIVVNTSSDIISDDGFCTLSEALISANTNTASGLLVGECAAGSSGAEDLITFAPTVTSPVALSDGVAITDSDGIRINGNYSITIQESSSGHRSFNIGSGGILYLENLTLTRSVPHSGGGGLAHVQIGGQLNIISTTLTGSIAANIGGAVYVEGGTLNVIASTFSSNTSSSAGGAISINGGTVNILNSTFSGNSGNNGGAIGNMLGIVNITASTFINNTGITLWANAGQTISVKGSLITGANTCMQVTSQGYNLFGENNNAGGCVALDSTDMTISGAVTSVVSTSLALNGEPTGAPLTAALVAESPALSKIPLSACTGLSSGTNPLFSTGQPITSDQRGIARPQPIATTCDIGAFESELTLTPPAPPITPVTPPIDSESSGSSEVAAVPVVVAFADSQFITKQVDKSIAQVGETVTFSIKLNNPKGNTLHQVVMSDTFDSRLDHLQVVSSSLGAATLSGNILTVQGFDLLPGQQAIIIVAARISTLVQAGEVITNIAAMESPDASIHTSNVVTITILPTSLPQTGETPLWRYSLFIMAMLITLAGAYRLKIQLAR
jgi:uncharacterized repeat protein (TIGR01451 family)